MQNFVKSLKKNRNAVTKYSTCRCTVCKRVTQPTRQHSEVQLLLYTDGNASDSDSQLYWS